MQNLITLGEFIIKNQQDFPYDKGELTRMFNAITLASKVMNSQINKAGLVDELMGKVGTENIQGEDQKKLDVYANKIFINALKARNEVCGIASEEEEETITFENESGINGKYIVLIDPIDGGTPAALKDFLQKGRQQVVAGYVIFGSSTMLVFTTGNGVNGFTYDPSIGVFYLSHPNIKIPKNGDIYSINEGNYAYFSDNMKAYIDYCKDIDTATNRPYTGRYIGSMIADLHRNFLKGGIYMYPDSQKFSRGKLRLLYECNPMAFLIEQAGGIATDGKQAILDIQPTEIHERTPFYGGSTDMVKELKAILAHKSV